VWIGLSYLLGIYFRHFANYNRTYGTLGGFVALLTWLCWTSFVLLVGAELNAALAKESSGELASPQSSPRNVVSNNDDIEHAVKRG
jgi:membrane protein